MADFHQTSSTLGSFVVSVFVLGFAIGPLAIGPLSESFGRQPVYLISSILFVVFTIACAVSSSFNQLIVFRFLSGCTGSAPLTLGGATIGDIFIPEQRGKAMAFWGMGPMIGVRCYFVVLSSLLTDASRFWAQSRAVFCLRRRAGDGCSGKPKK